MSIVLVVDDDPAIRLVLRVELAAEGHEVIEAGDGEEALARIDDWSPDLVLLDLMMPVLDGWEVLRRREGAPEPPIIVVSALATDDGQHVVEALRLGAVDFLSKPFEPGHLIQLVDAVLRVDQAERDHYRQLKLGGSPAAE